MHSRKCLEHLPPLFLLQHDFQCQKPPISFYFTQQTHFFSTTKTASNDSSAEGEKLAEDSLRPPQYTNPMKIYKTAVWSGDIERARELLNESEAYYRQNHFFPVNFVEVMNKVAGPLIERRLRHLGIMPENEPSSGGKYEGNQIPPIDFFAYEKRIRVLGVCLGTLAFLIVPVCAFICFWNFTEFRTLYTLRREREETQRKLANLQRISLDDFRHKLLPSGRVTQFVFYEDLNAGVIYIAPSPPPEEKNKTFDSATASDGAGWIEWLLAPFNFIHFGISSGTTTKATHLEEKASKKPTPSQPLLHFDGPFVVNFEGWSGDARKLLLNSLFSYDVGGGGVGEQRFKFVPAKGKEVSELRYQTALLLAGLAYVLMGWALIRLWPLYFQRLTLRHILAVRRVPGATGREKRFTAKTIILIKHRGEPAFFTNHPYLFFGGVFTAIIAGFMLVMTSVFK